MRTARFSLIVALCSTFMSCDRDGIPYALMGHGPEFVSLKNTLAINISEKFEITFSAERSMNVNQSHYFSRFVVCDENKNILWSMSDGYQGGLNYKPISYDIKSPIEYGKKIDGAEIIVQSSPLDLGVTYHVDAVFAETTGPGLTQFFYPKASFIIRVDKSGRYVIQHLKSKAAGNCIIQ